MTAILKAALNKALPIGTAMNLLKKIPGPVGNFVTGAITAGYATDEIINTVRNKFESSVDSADRSNLKKRESEGSLTPEERHRLSEKEGAGFGSFVKPAAALAGGIAAATLLPPGAGTAAQIVKSLGSKEDVEEEQSKGVGTGEAPAETGNIIQDTFPDLAVAVESAISQQGNPLAAGQLLKAQGKHSVAIGVLEKRSGMSFADLVASIYGGGEPQQQEQAPQQQENEPRLTKEQLFEGMKIANQSFQQMRSKFSQ